MPDAELITLRCLVKLDDGELAARFQLWYRTPRGEVLALNGSAMSGWPEDFDFSPAQLRGVAESYLQDAAGDLRRDGLDLDADPGEVEIEIVVDEDAAAVLDERRRRA